MALICLSVPLFTIGFALPPSASFSITGPVGLCRRAADHVLCTS
jgi:hypothetical protein